MNSAPQTIHATDFVSSRTAPVQWAAALADAVLSTVHRGQEHVEVSLVGLKGSSSSYYNMLFARLAAVMPAEAVVSVVRFVYESSAQQMIVEHSRKVVLANLASNQRPGSAA